jgi:hypothetical protein
VRGPRSSTRRRAGLVVWLGSVERGRHDILDTLGDRAGVVFVVAREGLVKGERLRVLDGQGGRSVEPGSEEPRRSVRPPATLAHWVNAR